MPKQETFFEQQVGERRIEVLKSYDQSYAHEAFKNMDEQALRSLWEALKPEEIYTPENDSNEILTQVIGLTFSGPNRANPPCRFRRLGACGGTVVDLELRRA